MTTALGRQAQIERATGADPAAPVTIAAITNYTAHASGATTVTSNAATDLDTTAAALATLEDEVTALRQALIDAGVLAAA